MVRKSISYVMGSVVGLDVEDLKNTIDSMMEEILDMTKEDLRNNIEIIPKDKGVMRATVLSNIEKSNYDAPYRLSIFFGANELPYAKYVEDMETEGNPHVRHADKDPKAEGHPFTFMANLAKMRVRLNWSKAKLRRGA